jgi:dCTP deaminase
MLLEALLPSEQRPDLDSRLVIMPYYDDKPVGAASWDLHLGNWFRVAKRTAWSRVNLAVKTERETMRREGQYETYVRFGQEFVLHPGDFALGISLEYVSLPGDLMAFVEGKSSLGRAGLLIATATQVAPGFKGCIVLELVNAGTVPLIVRPGMPVAQLVFHTTDRQLPPEWCYTGQFSCQVKP